ncbi:MAG: transketolase [Firmicutes bacterium]|nr:transketolase [Bacillota bacterium]
MTSDERKRLQLLAVDVREGILTAVHSAKSGHPGGSLSAADLFTYLYFKELRVDPKNPKDPDRDRFVLSKGHTCPGLYSVLAHKGFFPVEDLKTLRKPGSYLQGHPNMNLTPGVDASTGSLGQGISIACGMAKGAKFLGKDVNVYALLGDGELGEGQVWEAAMFAAHYQLDKLCAIVDLNGLQIDGRTADVMNTAPVDAKFEAFGWNVIKIDGHDFDQIEDAFAQFHANMGKSKPCCIIMKTTKGKGVSYMEDNYGWHGKAPNDEEYEQGMAELEAARQAIKEA